MGEEFGMSVYGKPSLRTAINDYTYSPPDTLPSHPAPGELGGEAHSFGQLLVGTIYEVLDGVYQEGVKEGLSQRDALVQARDVTGRLFVNGTDIAPPRYTKYKDIAQGMLKTDELENGGKYTELLSNVFRKRKILSDEDLNVSLRAGNESVFLNSSNEDGIVEFVDKNRDNFGIDREIPIKLDRVRKNDDGSEIFDITYTKEVELSGPEYGAFSGASIDVEGGVSLSTECSGQLCSTFASRVGNDEVNTVKNNLKEFIKEGRIKFVDPSAGKLEEKDLFDSKGRPYLGYTTYDQGKMKIVRSPIMV